jgi:hypothetical protein
VALAFSEGECLNLTPAFIFLSSFSFSSFLLLDYLTTSILSVPRSVALQHCRRVFIVWGAVEVLSNQGASSVENLIGLDCQLYPALVIMGNSPGKPVFIPIKDEDVVVLLSSSSLLFLISTP